MSEPTHHELSERIAVLEEKMNTSYERLRADMAKRDKDNLRWTVGFGIAQIAITIAILGAGFAFLALVGIPTIP